MRYMAAAARELAWRGAAIGREIRGGEPPRRWEAVYDARAAVRCAGRVRAAPRLVGCAPMELFVGCRFEDGQAISALPVIGPLC
jgi:hypothetical protein